MPKTASCISVFSLSPLCEAELVKPAATLSFQVRANHALDDQSMNVLNGAETLPM